MQLWVTVQNARHGKKSASPCRRLWLLVACLLRPSSDFTIQRPSAHRCLHCGRFSRESQVEESSSTSSPAERFSDMAAALGYTTGKNSQATSVPQGPAAVEVPLKFALGVELLMEHAANYTAHEKNEKALATLAPAERMLEVAGSPPDLASGFYMQYGATYASLSRFGEALQEYSKAWEILEKYNSTGTLDACTLSFDMAIAAAGLRRTQDSQAHFEKASQILDRTASGNLKLTWAHKLRNLRSMSFALEKAGCIEEGIYPLQQAWKVLREADASESLESAELLHHLGALHYYLAAYPKAAFYFDMARERHQAHGDISGMMRLAWLSVVTTVRGYIWNAEQWVWVLTAATRRMAEDWDPFADPADEDHQEPAQAVECKALVTSVLTTRDEMRNQETPLQLKAALDDTSTRSPDSSTLCAHEQPEVGGDDASKEPNLHSRAAVKTAPSQAMQGESPSPPPAAAEMPGIKHALVKRPSFTCQSGAARAAAKEAAKAHVQIRSAQWAVRGLECCIAGKDAGHAAWLLGLGSAIQEPAKELAEGAKEPEPEMTATVLEPLSKAREVESAEAESTREAESPRDTDSPVAKTVDQEASYIEGSTSTGDGAEAHISKGGVEETRIICETDPNEVIAWRASQLQLSHDSFFQPAYTVVTMTG
ncbi:unnamed protein product [Symbiodinium sp. KB8]|nr:unnamed protein product [Symbiodinium sp. KB8]